MNKPEIVPDHIAPTSDPLVVWVTIYTGSVFSALSSAWAFPQTPKVEESGLGLKPKTSNTFDPDHIYCVLLLVRTGVLALNLVQNSKSSCSTQ